MPYIQRFFRKTKGEANIEGNTLSAEDQSIIKNHGLMLQGAFAVLALKSAANLDVIWSSIYIGLYQASNFIASEMHPLYQERHKVKQYAKDKVRSWVRNIKEEVMETNARFEPAPQKIQMKTA